VGRLGSIPALTRAEAGAGGRGGLKAGEGGDGAGQNTTVRAPAGPRGGFRVVVWRQA
jgi:hypothetical protein